MPAPLSTLLDRLAAAAPDPARPPRLLAVGKTRPAADLATLAAAGQRAFGENYVQEAAGKIAALQCLGLEWHLIGHLQSNKARQAGALFDWVQTVDRAKLLPLLAADRPAARGDVNVLVQVNIDDEDSKHGCRPEDALALADAVAGTPRLALRGLMAIPAPDPDMARRRAAFRRMHALFESVRTAHPSADTLSMGMSGDFALAVAEGATMVRVGSALFGARG